MNDLFGDIGKFNVAMESVVLDHLQIKQDMDIKELFNRFDTLGNLSIFGNEIKVFKQSKVIRECLKVYRNDVLNLLALQGVDVKPKEFKENAFTLCCDLVSVYKNKAITKELVENVIKVYMVAVCSRLLEQVDDVFGLVNYKEKEYLKQLQENVNVAIDEIVENYIAEHVEPLGTDLDDDNLQEGERVDNSTMSELHEHGLSLMEMDTWDYPAIAYFNNLQYAPNLLDPMDLPEVEQSAIEYKQTLRNAIKNDLPIELEFDDGDTIELSVDMMNRILECDIFDMYKVMNASSLDEFMQLLSTHIPFYKSITQMVDELDDDLQEHVILQQLQTIAESKLQDMIVNLLEMTGVSDIVVADNAVMGSVNRKHFGGKIDIVNRVRDGKVQMRKRVSNTKGFRIKDGKIIKMSFAEKKKRKVGARIASRKRKVIMARILRKRDKSLALRQRRLGD